MRYVNPLNMEELLEELRNQISQDELYNILSKLVNQFALYEIIARLAVIASDQQTVSMGEQEDEYWDKSWRALLNLSRGELKWYVEATESEEE